MQWWASDKDMCVCVSQEWKIILDTRISAWFSQSDFRISGSDTWMMSGLQKAHSGLIGLGDPEQHCDIVTALIPNPG